MCGEVNDDNFDDLLAVDDVGKSGTRPIYFRKVTKNELESATYVHDFKNYVRATEASKQADQLGRLVLDKKQLRLMKMVRAEYFCV